MEVLVIFLKMESKKIFQLSIFVFAVCFLFQGKQVLAAYEYDSQFGTEGDGDGELYYPNGITVDSSGNIYVVDTYNYRVQKFNPSGIYQSQFGSYGSGNGQFNTPTEIVIDSSNNIYVTDSGNHRIQKFNSSGIYQSQFGTNGSGNGQFQEPVGIKLDSSGNIYVVDRGNHRIQKFNSSGIYQSQFGTNGSGNGQFEDPNGIAIDSSGDIYVADSNNTRIQKFNSSGIYQSQFGTNGSGNGEFDFPLKMALDSNDDLYVVDPNNSNVQKFNPSGVYQSQFGTYGTGDGEFAFPYGIAIDSDNNLYVLDNNNQRVQKFIDEDLAPVEEEESVEEENSPEESSSRAKITSFSVHSVLKSLSGCANTLKLAIKGRHLSDDVSVRIGKLKADSVSEISSKQIIAKFCVSDLPQTKEEISVRSEGDKRSTAPMKFDPTLITLKPEPNATFNPNTKEGILNIQKLLVSEKLLFSDQVTGVYDNPTFFAVKTYQIKKGLKPTGKIDAETTKAFRT